MIALHTPRTVFSLRHTPTWLLLAFAGGAANAIGFLACARFVTHVTGSISQIGIDAGAIALEYGAVLGCFVAGAMSSAALLDRRFHRGERPLYAAPLLAVAAILASLGVLGVAGFFGGFGGSLEGPRDFVFLSVLAFAMGLQNASVATSTGLLVRTTHMTGPATDLGVHLATAFFVGGEARRVAIRHAALRAGKIVSFTLGAAGGASAASGLGYGALFLPAAVIVAAAVLSFVGVPSLADDPLDPQESA